MKKGLLTCILLCLLFTACRKNNDGGNIHTEGRFIRLISHNGYNVNVFFEIGRAHV